MTASADRLLDPAQPRSTDVPAADPVAATLTDWLRRTGTSQVELADELALRTGDSWSQARVSRVLSGATSLGWQERYTVADALGLAPNTLGVTVIEERPAEPRNRHGYASNLAEAAELMRASGQSRAAVALLTDELSRTGWASHVPATQREREAQVELLLALAVARTDFTPADSLATTTIPVLKRARTLAAGLPTPVPHLEWKSSMRLGNELRKIGKTGAATVYLEQAYLEAPTQAERHQTLIPYARGLLAIRRMDELGARLRDIQEAVLEPENHSVSLHPLAALDLELRISLVADSPRGHRTEALRQQLDGTAVSLVAPPQWHLTWSVSEFADALYGGDLPLAIECRNEVRAVAETLGMPPTMKRLQAVDRAVFAVGASQDRVRARKQHAIALVAHPAGA